MSRRSPDSYAMAHLVLNVLVGARERWGKLTIRDQKALVKHMRAIANAIEICIGGSAP